MKKLMLLTSLCVISAMQSCTSEQDPVIQDLNEKEISLSHMVVKYQGLTYETDILMKGDSVEYLNEEYAELYSSEISKLPESATLVSTDESGTTCVEYFNSEKELQESYKFMQTENIPDVSSTPLTRGGTIDLWNDQLGIILGKAELYDDRDHKDTKLITYAGSNNHIAVPRLKQNGFNDKTSSIKVFNDMQPSQAYSIRYTPINADGSLGFPTNKTHYGSGLRPVLVCYHNSDYQGAVLYCIASPTGSSEKHLDYNLKKIKWNDRISAIGWMIVYDFSAFTGENPVIPAHPDC